MVNTRKLLVDADAFVALVCQNDSSHQRAEIFQEQIIKDNFELIVSDPAFGEAITVISQKEGLRVAVKFADEVFASPLEIIEVDPALRKEGLDIFKKQTSKNSRFTDCINMAIMKKLGLNTIFSFDVQYKKNKFKRFGVDK
ncbi:PIN domain-containing protein [Candidatus Daviesbacteria bacterium]|nr:PIN domain-containing protein [Candidatus Daviesbacteria bacterium]